MGLPVPSLMVNGENEGIRHSFQVSTTPLPKVTTA